MTRMVALALVAVSAACGAPPPPDEPAPEPAEWIAALDTLVPRLLESAGAPGAVVAVVEDGRVALSRGYGSADGTAYTDSTPVAVASVSKAVATWGALRLVESGAIHLDDPVGPRLSRWALPSDGHDPAGVTLRRLLSHTAGLGMPAVPSFPIDAARPTPEAVLSGGAGEGGPVEIERPPGARWAYSGGGFTVVELLIEDVTGRSFADYLRDAVLRPAGAIDSGFDGAATAVVGHDESGAAVPRTRYVGSAAAGLVTTARDFARLLVEYHLAWTGRSEILERTTIRRVAEAPVGVELEGVEGAAYGLGHGVHRRDDGSTLLYHTGGNPGVRAWFLVDPEAGDGIFVAVTSDLGVPVVEGIRDAWGAAHGGDLPPLY